MHSQACKDIFQETENYSRSVSRLFPQGAEEHTDLKGFLPTLRSFWKSAALLTGTPSTVVKANKLQKVIFCTQNPSMLASLQRATRNTPKVRPTSWPEA